MNKADGKFFVFDSLSHQYLCNGNPIPSVTKIIGSNKAYDTVPKEVLEQAKLDGTKRHYEIEMLLKHGKAVSPYAKKIDQYLFGQMRDYEIVCFEEPLFSDSLFFGGTPDLVMRKKNEWAILDWKRNIAGNRLHYELQLAGYAILTDNKAKIWRLIVGDEAKRMDIYNPLAIGMFRTLLGAYNIRQNLEN